MNEVFTHLTELYIHLPVKSRHSYLFQWWGFCYHFVTSLLGLLQLAACQQRHHYETIAYGHCIRPNKKVHLATRCSESVLNFQGGIKCSKLVIWRSFSGTATWTGKEGQLCIKKSKVPDFYTELPFFLQMVHWFHALKHGAKLASIPCYPTLLAIHVGLGKVPWLSGQS